MVSDTTRYVRGRAGIIVGMSDTLDGRRVLVTGASSGLRAVAAQVVHALGQDAFEVAMRSTSQ